MGEALTIEDRHERGYPVVTVAGEIDIATAARLRERLFELAAVGRPLVADLDQVRFIDSAGLAALVGAANRAAAHGGSLHVVCARPKVRQLFRLTGLDRRLPPARTLDEALDALMAARGTPPLAGRSDSRIAGPGPGARPATHTAWGCRFTISMPSVGIPPRRQGARRLLPGELRGQDVLDRASPARRGRLPGCHRHDRLDGACGHSGRAAL